MLLFKRYFLLGSEKMITGSNYVVCVCECSFW